MYVSIINTDPTSKSLSCIDAMLYISRKDIMENPFDPEDPGPMVFNVSEKYRNIVRYIRRLKSASKELAISIGLLHNLVYTKGNMTEGNLEDYFPGMTFTKKSNVLQGICDGSFESIVLDDIFMDILEELRTLYEACVGRVYLRPLDITCQVTSRVQNFIDGESCSIGKEIYRQIKRMGQFRVDYIPVTMRESYCIEFSNLPKFIYEQYVVITNIKTGQYAHIGGLTYDNLTKTFSIATDNKMDIDWFISYLRTSLDAIGIKDSVNDLCMDIIRAINSYRDNHHCIPGDDTDSTSSIFDGVEDIDYSEMYPSTDDENENDKPVEDDHGISISMNDLKWLLLYIADIVARESYTSISHALPVYVYKDNNGKLSATFNNMEPTLVGLDEVEKFNKYRYKFKIYPISDIMSYYNSTEMEDYKRFIGIRPDIRVIMDDDIIIN